MIDRQALLNDLQALLRTLEADLLERSESSEVPEVPAALKEEYKKAKDAERTARNYEDWRSDYITQVAAAWVLSCVFARFLEDNQLVDPPKIAGPGKRLSRARDEHQVYFTAHPTETDREYLLVVFDELAGLPGAKEVFGEHNAVRELPNWLSGDAAGELLKFFRRIDAETGVLVHDFTDPGWDTRFLGDLYQDLSEAARKKYALLQTPEFVEEFILDRTLDPAIDEFGLEGLRMIDPACGSGHFLLGSFWRLFDRWSRAEPGTNVRELAQRALDSVHGVDVNPYAVAISRFRLLLMAIKGCEISRLSNAPAFEFNLACGDSLYHGRETQMMLQGVETDESHYFRSEDAPALRRMLREETYHCVVANPPYITPKDRAANSVYRRLYSSCHMKYSLAVPFMERIFRLAVRAGDDGKGAGYTGQITSNSFMKREFGKKLIEEFFKTVDLTHVIDTSGAYIPGHGTPTVILFGRNRKPVTSTIRTVMGITGEPGTPADPAYGKVWGAIRSQIDMADSQSEFVSVRDLPLEKMHSHPWSIGGGGATEVKETLDRTNPARLREFVDTIGIMCFPMEDEIFILPLSSAKRKAIPSETLRNMGVGTCLRDWQLLECEVAVFPYDSELQPLSGADGHVCLRYLWLARTVLANNKMFGGKTKVESGLNWFEFGRLTREKLRSPLTIAYALVATHSQFVLDRERNIFKNSVYVIKLPEGATERDHLRLVGFANSSTACFWFKQVLHNKGSSVDQNHARQRTSPFEDFYAFNGSPIGRLPIPQGDVEHLSESIDRLARQLGLSGPDNTIRSDAQTKPLRGELSSWQDCCQELRGEMIRLQEDLDWQCYRLYGLIEEDLTYEAESFPIQLGQRTFEIVLARKMARGEVQTTWFERHGSTPITDLPADWPDDYRRLVERRIEVIESNPQIALIEQPEYKRRWNTEPWESQVERALREKLLNVLERLCDFDGRMGKPVFSSGWSEEDLPPEERGTGARVVAAQVISIPPVKLRSVAEFADLARHSDEFTNVGEVYRNDSAFNVQNLVEELVAAESVPLLPILRYKPAGLRKREQWEETWELQRAEDVIDARTKLPQDNPQHLTEQDATDIKRREVGDIPVPPKYKSSDFISSGGARYWSLRGKLDVPKERWVSFPYCEGEDGTLMIAWAGYNHLQLARAISTYYVDVQERLGGRDDPRLVPLLACLIELLPWLKQWHNEVDPEFGMAMGDYFEGFINEEARQMGKTVDEIRAWEPPKKSGGRRRKAKTR
jgi:hypothetical protein